MDFAELRLFLHLSRSLHFGHTSAECHISASALSRREAALLAAVLPNPVVLRVDDPSAYVMRRVYWIERQASQLGPAYLDEL